jgi:hypothetical protein
VTSIEAHVRMSHLNREAEDQVNITLTSRISQRDYTIIQRFSIWGMQNYNETTQKKNSRVDFLFGGILLILGYAEGNNF